ncbi:MAG TPA: hypothetical protein VFX02_12645 [Gammaproteobacteria bacterium]|nr:hypothetical protein [Gammaproteobacteria bacterium]
MLQQLYQQLAELYELDAPHRIEDFLITDPALAGPLRAATGQSAREQLFVREGERRLDVTLFLDRSVLANLKPANSVAELTRSEINDYWLAIEGISHFLYLTWRGGYERELTQLEMELQAEIDKYLCCCLSMPGLPLPGGRLDQWLPRLHHILFEQTVIETGDDPGRTERYATANRYAARYCRALLPRLRQEPSLGLVNELRRFYRLSQSEKLRRIDGLH